MVVPLDSPQPVFTLPPLKDILDTDEDTPKPGLTPGEIWPLRLSALIFGAASFSHQYNSAEHLNSTTPLRTVRLALRYGVHAFDTSAYYGPSEIVLGTALKALEQEFPRSSYQLMTKCGRYGLTASELDYSPSTIRRSVQRSLARLHTDYLDTVYLHDVEFVCTPVQPHSEGNHVHALNAEAEAYGLAPGQEEKIWGEGDQRILDAVEELRKMKSEGLVKNIGITGYPLPTLLRLALLVLHTAPHEPLDVVLSYSHLNLQNSTLVAFTSALRERARVRQLVTASPLNMGLLTPSPPSFHPASKEMREAIYAAHVILSDEKSGGEQGSLVDAALGYAYRKAREAELPTVVGLSRPSEVHETMRVWRELQSKDEQSAAKRRAHEHAVLDAIKPFVDFSWASP